MFLFTDFVPDIEIRYVLGKRYIALISAIFTANFMLISYEMFKDIKLEKAKREFRKFKPKKPDPLTSEPA